MMHDLVGSRFALIALIILMLGCAPTSAQGPLFGPSEPPGPFVREALASPYGRALMTELGKRLRAGADPACLQAKNLTAEQLPEKGEQLIAIWGTRAAEKLASLTDVKVYEAKFAELAGRNAAAEMKRLRDNAEVKRYLAIERPARLAHVLNFVFEQFDRYVLINRIKLDPVGPLASGNSELLDQNPTDDAEAALEKLVSASKSAPLRRFLALGEKNAAAVKAAIKPAEAAQAGPAAFVGGVETDLAALCIGKR